MKAQIRMTVTNEDSPGAGPRSLKRGFICINVWEFAMLFLSHFSKISKLMVFVSSYML